MKMEADEGHDGSVHLALEVARPNFVRHSVVQHFLGILNFLVFLRVCAGARKVTAGNAGRLTRPRAIRVRGATGTRRNDLPAPVVRLSGITS